MKRYSILFIALLLSLFSAGQNQVDALRYSESYSGGTARSVALGGAFGALGGDFFSVSQNPAGLGVYRVSELTITPELYYSKVKTRYRGNSEEDFRYNFNINNLGYVSAFNLGKKGLVSGSFAFGFNRLNNYYENIWIEGSNSSSSLADMFVESANYRDINGPVDLMDLEPFTEGLFYDGGIMVLDNDGYYLLNEDIRSPGGVINVNQRNILERSGRMNEWVLSLGFNYEHIVYFGASFSMIPLSYSEKSNFRETDRGVTRTDFFSYREDLTVSGMGYTGKFGVIIRPLLPVRLGFAYHLPVSYFLDEVYYADLRSYETNQIIYPIDPDGYQIDYAEQNYRIIAPAKAIGSLGFMLGKAGLLSADVEYMNYAAMRLSRGSSGYDFSYENNTIREIYRNNINIKTGAEFRLGKLYLRGGFGYYGSPYKKEELNADAFKLSYSGGLGIRDKGFSVDFALSYLTGEERHVLYRSPYDANPAMAEMNTSNLKAMVTFGFRF